jgi:hypothetical protein
VLGWFLSKVERIHVLRVLKPAFKEQIWILRLENAQIAQISALSLQYFLHKTAQSKEARV